MTQISKKAYSKPAVRSHGSIDKITLGGSKGGSLDATFPAGTPFGDLTFS